MRETSRLRWSKRKRGRKVHLAVDTLGHLLALHVTPANEQDRAQVRQLAQAVQFVLLPRRWVVERNFTWAARFRRLARDYERLPETLAGLHFLASAILMLKRLAGLTAHLL